MSARPIFILLLAFAGAAAAPGRAAGQDPDSARATFQRHYLCHGAQVMVSTTFGERFRGACVLQDARLLIVDRGVEEPILYTAVDSIWVRGPGTHAWTVTGAWVGAGIAGGLSALFIAALCEIDCGADLVLYTAGGAALGALTGGTVGALIGRHTRVWIRRYPR
jgi:hypothetical protein